MHTGTQVHMLPRPHPRDSYSEYIFPHWTPWVPSGHMGPMDVVTSLTLNEVPEIILQIWTRCASLCLELPLRWQKIDEFFNGQFQFWELWSFPVFRKFYVIVISWQILIYRLISLAPLSWSWGSKCNSLKVLHFTRGSKFCTLPGDLSFA